MTELRMHSTTQAMTQNWIAAPKPPVVLTGSGLDLWRVTLDADAGSIDKLATDLSEPERLRANRLKSPEHRQRFIVSHAGLRIILASYLGVEPGTIDFVASDNKKPALGDRFASRDLEFNLSHSQGMALVAVANKHAVGVDLERVRNVQNENALAARIMSKEEFAHFTTLDAQSRALRLFAIWTMKEAVVKAMGQGISFGLKRIEIADSSGPTRVSIDGRLQEAHSMLLLPMAFEPGFAAAAAICGPVEQVRYFDLGW